MWNIKISRDQEDYIIYIILFKQVKLKLLYT